MSLLKERLEAPDRLARKLNLLLVRLADQRAQPFLRDHLPKLQPQKPAHPSLDLGHCGGSHDAQSPG